MSAVRVEALVLASAVGATVIIIFTIIRHIFYTIN